jgi:hypothetical protein
VGRPMAKPSLRPCAHGFPQTTVRPS